MEYCIVLKAIKAITKPTLRKRILITKDTNKRISRIKSKKLVQFAKLVKFVIIPYKTIRVFQLLPKIAKVIHAVSLFCEPN
jgi:hypothetical protein